MQGPPGELAQDHRTATLPVDLRLLPSFVAVAEELHFARAAERLSIASPALSQQIRRLETQLGAALFHRNSRTVELTPAGRALLDEARAALHAVDRGARAARAAAARVTARLTVAVDFDVPVRITQDVENRALQLADVDVQIVRQHQGKAIAALHQGAVDMVLGWARSAGGPTLNTARVGAAEILAVLHREHAEAERASMPRSVFAQQRFIMFNRAASDVFDWLVTSATGRRPEQLEIEEVAALDNAMSAVLRGARERRGMTMAIEDAFDAAKDPDLVAMHFDPPLLHDTQLMWVPARESAATRALVHACAG